MSVQLEDQAHTELNTVMIGTTTDEAGMRTARQRSVASAARSSGSKMETATGREFTSKSNTQIAQSTVTMGFSQLYVGAVLILAAINLYVESVVNLFHVGYFSYRKPAVSKDLIKTAYHLLKVSYDNSLLSLKEIYLISSNNIIQPMARQNRQHYDETQRTAPLKTMRITSDTNNKQ